MVYAIDGIKYNLAFCVLIFGSYQLISALVQIAMRRSKLRNYYWLFSIIAIVSLFIYQFTEWSFFMYSGGFLSALLALFYLYISYKEYRDYYTEA